MTDTIIITRDSYSWNQNGKLKFHKERLYEKEYEQSIGDEGFPIVVSRKSINYVVDKQSITYGRTTVREIFVSLSDGYMILWNECAISFLSQYKGNVLKKLPSRSVTLGGRQ